jgi:dTDP-4-amino-4,6-dideoxygalactose transaminase
MTEQVYRRILTLPISASMTLADARYVADHLIDLLG